MNNTNIAKKCAGKKYINTKIQLDITNICENEDDELASQQNSFLRIKVIEALCVYMQCCYDILLETRLKFSINRATKI